MNVKQKNISEIVTQTIYKSCITEVNAFKPGNVSVESAGHGMTAKDSIRSAELISPVMGMPDLSIGDRVLQSVQLTMSQVGCNTNLGIILLAAPLAQASFQKEENRFLQQVIYDVLESLTRDDAEKVFEAISLANPGGLGEVDTYDVNEAPNCSLMEGMQAAQYRDRIAWQYSNGFKDIFETGVNTIRMQVLRWKATDKRLEWATVACYLKFLALIPDSHVTRKHGITKSEQVLREAQEIEKMFVECADPVVAKPQLQDYDNKLKQEQINPGTSADLTVASLIALSLDALL